MPVEVDVLRKFRQDARVIQAAHASMFENSGEANAWFNLQGEVFYWNRLFTELLQIPEEKVPGMNIFMLLGLADEFEPDFYRLQQGSIIKKEIALEIAGKTRHFTAKFGPLRMEEDIFAAYLILADVTEEKQQEAELEEREFLLRRLVNKAGLGIVIINQEHAVIEANQRFADMLGYSSPQEMIGMHTWDWTVAAPEKRIRQHFADLSKIDIIFETKHRRKDGTVFDVEVSASGTSIPGKNGKYNAVICICKDITQRKAAEQEIMYLSFHDSLTGLFNRRFLEEELRRIDVARNLPISIIVGDVNGLKLINDAFGHYNGDTLLKTAADVMRKVCRADDLIARWGGDEFVIVLPKTDRQAARQVLERIREKCSAIDVEMIKLSISLGLATKEDYKDDIFRTLLAAETDMYRCKLKESQGVIRQTIDMIHGSLLKNSKIESLHCKRVASLCREIALAMGFSQAMADEMEVAGLLHDIGKIGIPKAILEKEGILTPAEWSEICRHPEIGYRILSASNETSDIANYILSHHERYDGAGYPTGLQGTEIPLQARILAVADAFVAMTSARPYRAALSWKEAVKELQENAGKQFDPEIVKILVNKVLRKNERTKTVHG
jgi:diguanylate cyclase (GGDEF)-like protein/PAS domain S-box-containing protein/putative nucleotidyltransferase with HDIG domain